MAKAELGTKRTCQECGTKYYDLKKSPPVCPSCGTAFDPEALLKSRRSRLPVDEPKVARPVKEAVVEEDEVLAEEEIEADEDLADDADEGEAVIEDASELGDDEDEVELEVEDTEEEH